MTLKNKIIYFETLLLATVFFLLIFLLTGIDARAGEKSADALVWGLDAEGGAPYVFPDPEDPSRLIGFEVDLAKALARELGKTAKQFQTDWSSLIPALQRGDFDIALNGIEWTEERAREAGLSDPYYIFSQQTVVRAGETRIRSFSDLPGNRVATLEGTTAHTLLKKTPGVDIAVYEGQVEPYRDLKLGRVDAVLLDMPIAVYYARPDPELKFAGPPVGEDVYVIAVRKDNPELLRFINKALNALFRSGEFKTIYSK